MAKAESNPEPTKTTRVVPPGRRPRKRQQIVNDLRTMIVQGKIDPGARLPSQNELQTRYGTGTVTVQNAPGVLARDGFIETDGTRGTFVSRFPPHLTHYGVVSLDLGHALPDLLKEHRLETRPEWNQYLSPWITDGVRHVVRLLMSLPEPPDGLIVMDDNLVPGVSDGLTDAGVNPDRLTVVSHCNAPYPTRMGEGGRCTPTQHVGPPRVSNR